MKGCEKMTGYNDIIDLPHPVSKNHPQMPLKNRAAQFMPFAALAGYNDAVDEAARLTEEQIILEDDAVSALNRQITEIQALDHPLVTMTYFAPDDRKEGGAYRTVTGIIKKIRSGEFILEDGLTIPFDRLLTLNLAE